MGVRASSSKRCVTVPVRLAGWGAALCVCLAAASCGYFDPLHPYADPKPADTSVTWERHIGEGHTNIGNSVQQTADGGFVFTGYTDLSGPGNLDLWLVKMDATGSEQWSKTFGEEAGDDRGHSVLQTPDGGYLVAGSTTSFGAVGTDIYLVKTDAGGNETWHKTFGGSQSDEGWSVLRAADGGYVIAGFTSAFDTTSFDPYLIKTNSAGDFEWGKHYGKSACDDRAYSVSQTADGGYVMAGYTQNTSPGDVDALLLKTDATGAEQWSRLIGGDWPDCATAVEQTSDGGYILCGYTRSYGEGDFNAWLVKTDSVGGQQWNRAFGGDAYDRAECMRQTPDSGFILAGMTRSYGYWNQAWLIRTDATGAQEWSKTFGGPDNDWGLCVQLTSDGGYIMTGYAEPVGGDSACACLVYYRP